VDKVNQMQDRIKTKLGVESTYKGPDPACLAIEIRTSTDPDACAGDSAGRSPGAVGHEFEFLGAPRDYPDCRYCWVIEENDVLMWIVLPNCSSTRNNVMLAF
jgi:hypothetical protein